MKDKELRKQFTELVKELQGCKSLPNYLSLNHNYYSTPIELEQVDNHIEIKIMKMLIKNLQSQIDKFKKNDDAIYRKIQSATDKYDNILKELVKINKKLEDWG